MMLGSGSRQLKVGESWRIWMGDGGRVLKLDRSRQLKMGVGSCWVNLGGSW